MKKYLIWVFIVLLTFSGYLLSSPKDFVNQSNLLKEWIQEALENNPRLEAAHQRVLSTEKVIPQAGALPDPQLSFGLSNLPVNSFSFNQEPMTGKVIGIMQMFPFPGKLSLSTDIAEYEAAAVKYQKEEIRNQIIQMVKNAYFDLYAVDRAIETTEKNKALMKQFIHMAETKYKTGSGLQQDVLRAQVEISKLEDEFIMWKQKRISVTARLNALLNRPVYTRIEKTSLGLMIPDGPKKRFSAEEIEKNRPLLKAWHQKIQKAETEVELTERDVLPDFMVGASYRQRSDLADMRQMTDFFSATLSVDIPLYMNRKQKAKVAEREMAFKAVKSEYENIKINVLSEIESILAELERNRKRVELYKGGLLIQAQQSLESAQAGYKVGKVDFLTLINNRMLLQNYELQYFFAVSDFHKSLAEYELAVGIDVMQATESKEPN
ncbi:MAG TPA: TolC family protein [Acidobacteriota bacterium]|nr:TolC family protein [Acidobacteriota bacterium]